MINQLRAYLKKIASTIIREYLFTFQAHGITASYYKAITKFKPDIVHCHDWQTLELGDRLKRETGAKLIFDSHELETHRNPPMSQKKKKWIEAYEARLLPQADLVTTVSPGIANYLGAKYNIDKPKLVLNTPLANSDDGPISSQQRWGRRATEGGLRAELKLGDEALIIVMIGNISSNRGFETVAHAIARLQPNIHLACVGKITSDFLSIFQKVISRLSLYDRVHHVKPVNPVDVVDFIASADIAVIPLIPETLSYELSLPNKLFEAAFADLPIVASNAIEIARLIEQYDLGDIYDPESVEDSCMALEQFIQHWTGPGSLKRNNDTFRREFDFVKHLNVFETILEDE